MLRKGFERFLIIRSVLGPGNRPLWRLLRCGAGNRYASDHTVTRTKVVQQPAAAEIAGTWRGRRNTEPKRQHPDGGDDEKGQERSRKWRLFWWSPLPILTILSLFEVRRLKDHNYPLKRWEISCYRLFPWRTLSRTWGFINTLDLPLFLRVPFISWYARTFACSLEEAELGEDVAAYRNLGEFFRRSLKSGVRPICPNSLLVSPADGTLLHSGPVPEGGMVEQVKGVAYSLQAFLGPNTWTGEKEMATNSPRLVVSDAEYEASLLTDPIHNGLYTAVIYLAPGDYHRFHSPVNWNVQYRRHFPGELLSVNPRMAGWIPGLFTLNERALYVGQWRHGFFSMTAVGATNVGSIRVYSDPELSTNGWVKGRGRGGGQYWKDKSFLGHQGGGGGNEEVRLGKGDPFGEFNLGSTIVLLFEAPKPRETSAEEDTRSGTTEYKWVQGLENKVRVGRPLHPPS